MTSMSCKLEPAIWSHDTGQQIPYFYRCQLIITWMSDIKEVPVNQSCMSLSIYYWSMAAMLRDSTAVVVVVVRTRPRAIPLAMVHMRKSIHGFPSVPLYGYGTPLGGLRPPELRYYRVVSVGLGQLSFDCCSYCGRSCRMQGTTRKSITSVQRSFCKILRLRFLRYQERNCNAVAEDIAN